MYIHLIDFVMHDYMFVYTFVVLWFLESDSNENAYFENCIMRLFNITMVIYSLKNVYCFACNRLNFQKRFTITVPCCGLYVKALETNLYMRWTIIKKKSKIILCLFCVWFMGTRTRVCVYKLREKNCWADYVFGTINYFLTELLPTSTDNFINIHYYSVAVADTILDTVAIS